jgi:hypothetical protein
MENVKYNGWANRDTWLVALWLNNSENNYNTVKAYYNLLAGADSVMLRNTFESGIWIFGDEINFSKVNYKEIARVIKEIGTDG